MEAEREGGSDRERGKEGGREGRGGWGRAREQEIKERKRERER